MVNAKFLISVLYVEVTFVDGTKTGWVAIANDMLMRVPDSGFQLLKTVPAVFSSSNASHLAVTYYYRENYITGG